MPYANYINLNDLMSDIRRYGKTYAYHQLRTIKQASRRQAFWYIFVALQMMRNEVRNSDRMLNY
jgi:hypothetical protein